MKKHVLKQKLEVLKKSKNEEEDSYKKQNNAVGRIKDERERNRPICKECETKKLVDCWHCFVQTQKKRQSAWEFRQSLVDKVGPHKCAYCRKQCLKSKFQACNDCDSVSCCGQLCQRKHWKVIRNCVKLQSYPSRNKRNW